MVIRQTVEQQDVLWWRLVREHIYNIGVDKYLTWHWHRPGQIYIRYIHLEASKKVSISPAVLGMM